MSYYKAIEAGDLEIDCTISAFASETSHPATETMHGRYANTLEPAFDKAK
jgi:pyruvate/oxaloacetate carboxyltransferase